MDREEDLIQRAQTGDTLAFRALVEQYTPVAWRIARIFIQNRAQAEDALQEAWIDVWRGLPRLDVSRPFRPWLLAVVANRCRMLVRRPTLPTLTLNAEIAEAVSDPDDVLAALSSQPAGNALQAVLATLPAEQRQLLALRYQAELDLAEIAEVCALPLSTIKSRLYRTLTALRTQLTTASTTTSASSSTPR